MLTPDTSENRTMLRMADCRRRGLSDAETAPNGGYIYIDTPGYPDEYRITFLDRAQKQAPQLKPRLLAAGDDLTKLVHGYTGSDGTYVQGYMRSSPQRD
jgi:hypothetical protein